MDLTPTAQLIVNTMNYKALKDAQAIQRVRDLHKPFSPTDVICDCCACVYPCPTIKALDGEQ